jgi:hypothetical protein
MMSLWLPFVSFSSLFPFLFFFFHHVAFALLWRSTGMSEKTDGAAACEVK